MNQITQIDNWTLLRADDGLCIELQQDGKQLDGVFTLDTLPEDLKAKLHRKENVTQLIFVITYAKLCDRFSPILTQYFIDDYRRRHPDSAGLKLPEFQCEGDCVKALTYYAEAIIRGNPLYHVRCLLPLTEKSKCSAYPASMPFPSDDK
ncbi:MAG: hypothetical protein LBB38_00335 [Puniceicoccales bacterium]|jgi:hypothetical protein|nr:hypothetical protein [Puniceicoccales bacterium]